MSGGPVITNAALAATATASAPDPVTGTAEVAAHKVVCFAGPAVGHGDEGGAAKGVEAADAFKAAFKEGPGALCDGHS